VHIFSQASKQKKKSSFDAGIQSNNGKIKDDASKHLFSYLVLQNVDNRFGLFSFLDKWISFFL
jgi:hypothetical protein